MKLKMTKDHRDARRKVGIAKFERECRTIQYRGRKVKAYRVVGTADYGTYVMLRIHLGALMVGRKYFTKED